MSSRFIVKAYTARVNFCSTTEGNEPPGFSLWGLLQIDELEEQCSEINREKERNTQLKRRIEELESELREKEMVSGGARRPCGPGTPQVSGRRAGVARGRPQGQHGAQPRAALRLGHKGEPDIDKTVGNFYR